MPIYSGQVVSPRHQTQQGQPVTKAWNTLQIILVGNVDLKHGTKFTSVIQKKSSMDK